MAKQMLVRKKTSRPSSCRLAGRLALPDLQNIAVKHRTFTQPGGRYRRRALQLAAAYSIFFRLPIANRFRRVLVTLLSFCADTNDD